MCVLFCVFKQRITMSLLYRSLALGASNLRPHDVYNMCVITLANTDKILIGYIFFYSTPSMSLSI